MPQPRVKGSIRRLAVLGAKMRHPCRRQPSARYLSSYGPSQSWLAEGRTQGNIGMFTYYLELAARSLRQRPGLTALMILAIGFGVAASMTTYSVFRGLSADPIPSRSSRLFVPQIDAWGPEHRDNG